jgi:predicted AAA+ superfamily ATPase
MVADSDRDGTSPGKEVLVQLLKKAAPCVILLDELVAFIRQLETGKSYSAGTFDSNLSFVQALTEGMKSVPNALLLASLPESEIEAAGPMGKLALETLEKYFARVESVWKPVATEEAFEIVKRRLFESVGDKAEIETVCNAFFNYYIENNNKFPY